MRRASRSSVWRAARPADRSRQKSPVGSAGSTAPAPLQPHRPEPARTPKARRCTCKSTPVTTTTTSVTHAGEQNGSLLLVYEDGLHAQGAGYSTGMLAARTAKTGQHVLRGIVTLSLRRRGDLTSLPKSKPFTGFVTQQYLRQGSDWPTHGLVRDSNESHGNLLHTHPLRGVLRFVVAVCNNLRWKKKSNTNEERQQENVTFRFSVR